MADQIFDDGRPLRGPGRPALRQVDPPKTSHSWWLVPADRFADAAKQRNDAGRSDRHWRSPHPIRIEGASCRPPTSPTDHSSRPWRVSA